jgi:hypothetical protein
VKSSHASSTIAIHTSADAAWRVISDFSAAGRYLPTISNCTVEGAGVGARRTLTHADGSTIVERLEALDEAAHRLRYALLTGIPFRNCLTTVSVRGLGVGQCEVEWSATFEADGPPAHEAVELLEGALAANCRALKQLFEQ